MDNVALIFIVVMLIMIVIPRVYLYKQRQARSERWTPTEGAAPDLSVGSAERPEGDRDADRPPADPRAQRGSPPLRRPPGGRRNGSHNGVPTARPWTR